MATGNSALMHYFLQDDLYLLNADKSTYTSQPAQPVPVPEEALVLPTAESPAEVPDKLLIETPEPAFKYLGGNKKQFLILVNYPAEEYMAEAHLKALESTLNRKTLTIDDVAIVNTAKHPDSRHTDLIAFFSPQKLLVLGAKALPAGLTPPRLNSIEQLQNTQQLFTHSFTEMLADREMAKAFWEQMKNL